MIPTHFSAPAPVGLSADGRALGDGEGLTVLREAMVLLDLAQAETGSARAPALCHALTEAARALAGVHAYAPAESHLAQALRWAATMGGHDLCADLECAWSEVATNAADLADVRGEQAASRAARDRARDHAVEAARLAALVTDPNWEIRVLLRASDVFDRCGDHDDAVLLQQRALVLMGLSQDLVAADEALTTAPSADGAPMTAPGHLM